MPTRKPTWIPPIYQKVLSSFLAHGVKFLVVGGYAVNYHGLIRNTKDLDLLILPTPENGARLAAALGELGYSGFAASDLLDPQFMVQLGREPYRLDILNTIDGVTYEEAQETAESVRDERLSLELMVLGRAALIKNKSSSGRPQDLADVARLQSVAPGPGAN